eukprot:gene10012-biopygen6246
MSRPPDYAVATGKTVEPLESTLSQRPPGRGGSLAHQAPLSIPLFFAQNVLQSTVPFGSQNSCLTVDAARRIAVWAEGAAVYGAQPPNQKWQARS